MYKIKKRQEDPITKINNTKNFLDIDSGIVTESESEFDNHGRSAHYIFSDDDEEVNMTLNQLGDINNIPRQTATASAAV